MLPPMATKQSTADFLTGQIASAGVIRNRKMFGEYAIYCDEKVVALVCDDRLYVKPTEEGRVYLEKPEMAPPYPGSKDFFVIEEDRWEDRDWLTELIRITAQALPVPKKRLPKKR